ncbi:MAG: agmatinase [Bacteroidota bacterium]
MLPKNIALVGVPWDQKSSYLQGAALAPNRIRAALHGGSANYWTELNVNPIEDAHFHDAGDLSIKTYTDIEKHFALLLSKNVRTLSLGGDHSITYPIIKAHYQFREPFDILQIDAHGDLYDEFEGDKFSHACPFARIMEQKLASRLMQVGIRAINPHQRAQMQRFGVETIEMHQFEAGQRPTFDKPIYVSLDLDGLDPAYAPGVSHHEPGGLTTREVLRLIQQIDVPIIGADIVEYNPHRDVSDQTAMVAAKLMKEIAGKMLR